MKYRQALLAALLGLTVSSAAAAFPIALAGTEGLSVLVSGAGPVIATYQGNSATYSNDLYLSLTAIGPGLDGDFTNDTFIFNNHTTPVGTTFDLGSFALGTELIFRLYVNNTGYNYFTGLASRNPDGMAHARVQTNWNPGESLVSFEDLYGLPEGVNGYNDLSFSFTNTSGGSVPDPGSSLLLLGIGLVGLRAWRRR